MIRRLVLAMAAVVLAAGCGADTARRDGVGNAVGSALADTDQSTPARPVGTLAIPKAGLQSTLNTLFTDHVRLVLATTNLSASGQAGGATAERAELDQNSDAIVGAIVGVYGSDAAIFGQGWRMHVQAFVDYAAASAADDAGEKADARKRLDGYPKQVGGFLASANPNLTQQAVADLVATHIADILANIDQQVGAQPVTSDLAFEHMTMLATALADAIAQQFPARFPS
ncbi:MAG: hypothetical protein HYX32_02695 [Actinobacteria bacterium]|nr:hypothetical protein [Actinomycetota bacterium]